MRLLAVAVAALCLGAAPSPPIERLYVFGDSYSDSGAGYVDGDGPTAVVYAARRLGVELKPATQQGGATDSLNFAVSGAQTGSGAGRRVGTAQLGLGMVEQVDDFVARVRAGRVTFDPARTLFFLAGGLNDRRLPGATTVANITGHIQRLHAAGGRRFRVALLPTAIPQFAEVGLRLNPELAGIPAGVRAAIPGIDIGTSLWGPHFDTVMRNPAQYGIENTTDRCAGRALFNEDPTPCPKPAAYYFYHPGHPSTAVHRVVGDLLYEELKTR